MHDEPHAYFLYTAILSSRMQKFAADMTLQFQKNFFLPRFSQSGVGGARGAARAREVTVHTSARAQELLVHAPAPLPFLYLPRRCEGDGGSVDTISTSKACQLPSPVRGKLKLNQDRAHLSPGQCAATFISALRSLK